MRKCADRGLERWAGKVAVVTGASSGIGRALVRQLSLAKLRVAGVARRHQRLEELAEELPSGQFLPLSFDLRQPGASKAAFVELRKAWGGCDVLVNNAGLGHQAPLTEDHIEAWQEMLELNVLALSACTYEAISDMRCRGDDGHVIHVSSMAAHRVPPGSGMYSATKYAVRALTEALRQELREAKSKIRVTAISPGFVETEFAAHYFRSDEKAREIYSHIKVLSADDVADAIVYALGCPPHMQIHDLLIRPRDQQS